MTPPRSAKVALVAASSRGIGFGIARSLRDAGARVCICGRREEELQQAAEALGAPSPDVLAVPADLADAADVRRLVSTASERLGPIDILVNNSGGPPTGEALAMTDEHWSGAIAGNLLSVIRLCALIAPSMQQRRWGRIVNLTSTTAKEPDPGMVLSSVTRAGVVAYSKTLARELGPSGVTVNTILTGGVLTERMRALMQDDATETGEAFEDALARAVELFPVRFIPTPEAFAATIRFIVSDEAGFLTGAAIPLDGGVTRSAF
jgi:3-oxoacyl-[acyl-carrier protein] reductase